MCLNFGESQNGLFGRVGTFAPHLLGNVIPFNIRQMASYKIKNRRLDGKQNLPLKAPQAREEESLIKIQRTIIETKLNCRLPHENKTVDHRGWPDGDKSQTVSHRRWPVKSKGRP